MKLTNRARWPGELQRYGDRAGTRLHPSRQRGAGLRTAWLLLLPKHGGNSTAARNPLHLRTVLGRLYCCARSTAVAAKAGDAAVNETEIVAVTVMVTVTVIAMPGDVIGVSDVIGVTSVMAGGAVIKRPGLTTVVIEAVVCAMQVVSVVSVGMGVRVRARHSQCLPWRRRWPHCSERWNHSSAVCCSSCQREQNDGLSPATTADLPV